MTQPGFLIVSPYLPELGAGGSKILQDLLSDFPSENLFWASMWGPHNYSPSWRKEIPRQFYPFPFRLHRFRFISLLERTLSRFLFRAFRNRLSEIIREFSPDFLWLIADANNIRMLYQISSFFNSIPVHLSIHDDPLLLVSKLGIFPPDKRKNDEYFRGLLNNAASVDSVSIRLLEKYAAGKKTAIVTRGVDYENSKVLCSGAKTVEKKIRIILGGMGQNPPPWPKDLIDGVKLLQSEIPQQVSFHTFDFTMPTDGKTFFREPFVSPEAFDRMLSDFHFGYCCDPFDDFGREFARTSFSTKLVTYVVNGLPFLYHGPKDSTANLFLKKYPAGVVVDSHDPRKIADGFKWLIKNYDRARTACKEATENEFNLKKIRTNFLNLFLPDRF